MLTKEEVYKFYKPFKDVKVGEDFVYGPSVLRKCELERHGASASNCISLTNNSFVYVADYDWVIVLD